MRNLLITTAIVATAAFAANSAFADSFEIKATKGGEVIYQYQEVLQAGLVNFAVVGQTTEAGFMHDIDDIELEFEDGAFSDLLAASVFGNVAVGDDDFLVVFMEAGDDIKDVEAEWEDED